MHTKLAVVLYELKEENSEKFDCFVDHFCKKQVRD